MCYSELQHQISTIADGLYAMGIGRDSRVALVLPNGPEMAIAFLAVASCATCAPLNPSYTADDFAFYLDDLGVDALIVLAGIDSPARTIAQRLKIQILELRFDGHDPAGSFTIINTEGFADNGSVEYAHTDDVALVLHTSGTTGRPKQVRLTHANLCASAANIAATLRLTSDDRCLNIMPLFHIHGLIAAVLASIAAGSSVACTPGITGGSFFDWLDELRPTWFTAVPTMLQHILASASDFQAAIQRNPLRFIRSASAPLSPALMAALERCFNAPVIEAYGMTEAAHQIASNPLPPGLRRPGSVGLAAGPEIAICDEAGTLLPQGARGEVVIRGSNVTNSDADPMIQNSVGVKGWLRTGDQGWLDADGYLFLTGRLKEIIKRGGETISPREIDAVIESHPGVHTAIAFGVPHRTLGEEIVAAVVKNGAMPIQESDILEWVRNKFGMTRVPRKIYFVADLPRTESGKVRRSELPRLLGITQPGLSSSHSVPNQRQPASGPLHAGVSADITKALEAIARTQPTASAIHVPGRASLTYADLGTQIGYVRERLRGWGFVCGDVIVGIIPLRPEMAVAIATVPSTATFAPMSPALTSNDYAELLTRLRPKAILLPLELDHPARLAARRCGVAEIELVPDPSAPAGMFRLELTRQQASQENEAVSHPEWAYLLATSGATGDAKLVPKSHARLEAYARNEADWASLCASDVACHLIPMHHSAGLVTALLIPLLRGASVLCLPEADIDGFFAALEKYRVTWLMAAFSIHREVLRRAPDFPDAVILNRLRYIRVLAGRLEPAEIDNIELTFGAPVFQSYGMTEAYSIASDPQPPRTRKHNSVGVAACNQVTLIDDTGAFCATGTVGEIIVRGPLVFEGYFDDAEASAAAFINGWFRTGDLGRFDEDGYLYLVGRIKELINRGGEKISPAELDTVIAAIPGIRAAATFAIPHPNLGEEIGAAVIRNGDAAISASEVIDQVRRRLGTKRTPRQIYFVDELPLTDNGKVRRAELPRLLGLDQPAVAVSRSVPRSQARATTSPLAAALTGLWMSELQITNVEPDDDFFLLGGDSLRGMQLLVKIKAVFGVDLPFELLLREAATIAGMARAIEEARARAAVNGSPFVPLQASIPRRSESGAAILSDTQRRMWFLAQLNPGDASYNESRAYRLLGEVNVQALAKSVNYIATRHEILRTSYSVINGEPRQIVRNDHRIELKRLDVGAVPSEEQGETIRALLHDEMRRPFDLETGPLLRVQLVRHSAVEHQILFTVHHIASDGWSAGVFDRELV